jgi:hypothetical protein
MNTLELIDSFLAEVGADKTKIFEARKMAEALYAGDPDAINKMNKELTPEQEKKYRDALVIYSLVYITDPEFRENINARVNKIRERN